MDSADTASPVRLFPDYAKALRRPINSIYMHQRHNPYGRAIFAFYYKIASRGVASAFIEPLEGFIEVQFFLHKQCLVHFGVVKPF